MKKLILLCCLVMGLGFNQAHALDSDGSLIISVAGLANDTVDDYEDDEHNYGAAVLIEAGVNDHFGIETGVLYTKLVTSLESSNATLAREVDRLHVPIAARVWLFDFFSIAAGPFASFRTGSVENRFDINGQTFASNETSADDDVRFGYDVAATFNLAVADKTGFFVELRHSSFFDDEDDEESDQLYGLAGFKFDI